jgi:hypothetical protein
MDMAPFTKTRLEKVKAGLEQNNFNVHIADSKGPHASVITGLSLKSRYPREGSP